MRILSYARGLGNTYEAVKYSKENNCMIVVSSEVEKRRIEEEYGFKDVYTLLDVQNKRHKGKYYKGAVFDNIDSILLSLMGLTPSLLTFGIAELNLKQIGADRPFVVSSLRSVSPTSLDYYSG